MRGVAARRKLLEVGVVPMSNATGPTLIVSPLSVLQTWVDQLQAHTDGSLLLITWSIYRALLLLYRSLSRALLTHG
jgi:hypothetical protein